MFQRTVSFWRRLLGPVPTSASAASVAEDRRQALRYRSDQVVYCSLAGSESEGQSNLKAQLRDVSAGGISLLMDKAFRPGELLSVQLPEAAGEKPTSVLACVVHVGRQSDDHWTIGCTFSGELSPAELGSFGTAPIATPADAEQRGQPRHDCVLESNYQLLGQELEENWPAQVLNISTAGVGLAINQPVSVGGLLNVDLHTPDRVNSRNLLCCAVHVTELGAGNWLVGCNFITELEEQELKTLLGQ